jgi:hypothetical protein
MVDNYGGGDDDTNSPTVLINVPCDTVAAQWATTHLARQNMTIQHNWHVNT